MVRKEKKIMGKQKKHLLILVVLLIVIVGGYFGLQAFNKKKAIDDLQRNTVRVFNNTQVTSFTYSYGSKSYSLEKQEGRWVYTEDPSLELDDTLISAMLTVAADIPVADTIENVTDFEQYGLTEPYLSIVCSDGEKEYTVLMGDYSNTISKYFIRINGEDKVYTTDSSLYHTFTKTVESLTVQSE